MINKLNFVKYDQAQKQNTIGAVANVELTITILQLKKRQQWQLQGA